MFRSNHAIPLSASRHHAHTLTYMLLCYKSPTVWWVIVVARRWKHKSYIFRTKSIDWLYMLSCDCRQLIASVICLISIVGAFVFIFAHFFLLSLSQFVLCGRTSRMRQTHSTNSSKKKIPKKNLNYHFYWYRKQPTERPKTLAAQIIISSVFCLSVCTENPQAIIYIATTPKLFYAVVLDRLQIVAIFMPVRNQTWSIFSTQPL